MYRYIKYHVHPDGQRSETDRGIVWHVSDALELVLATKEVAWLELKVGNQVTRWHPYEEWVRKDEIMENHEQAIAQEDHQCTTNCYLWSDWLAFTGEDPGDVDEEVVQES